MSRRLLIVLCGVMVLGLMAGCKTQEGPPMISGETIQVTESSEEPAWITSASRAYPDKANDVFFGVGVAEAKRVPSLYLRRRSAIQRGTNEVAGQIETFVASIFKDYSEAAWTPSMDKAESHQLTSSVQKSIIASTITGAKVAETWKDPTTGDFYTLIELSMDTVASQLKSKMAEVEKGKLRIAAEQAHDELDKIIAEKRGTINQ